MTSHFFKIDVVEVDRLAGGIVELEIFGARFGRRMIHDLTDKEVVRSGGNAAHIEIGFVEGAPFSLVVSASPDEDTGVDVERLLVGQGRGERAPPGRRGSLPSLV